MNATSYIELGVKTIGQFCKDKNISLEELLKAFPKRPTTKAEFDAIAKWVVEHQGDAPVGTEQASSINPPRRSSQAKADWSAIATRRDKSGKALPSYYAVERDGKLKFYRVKAGRKAGYYFVDAQASDEMHPVRHFDTVKDILNTIAQDPKGAMERYGQEIGSCGHCHRTLTDPESRAYGIGPVCRESDY